MHRWIWSPEQICPVFRTPNRVRPASNQSGPRPCSWWVGEGWGWLQVPGGFVMTSDSPGAWWHLHFSHIWSCVTSIHPCWLINRLIIHFCDYRILYYRPCPSGFGHEITVYIHRWVNERYKHSVILLSSRVIQLPIRPSWLGLRLAPPSYVYLRPPLNPSLRNTQRRWFALSR